MRDAFSQCHPIVSFLYFFTVIAFSMFFLHPVLLAISLAGGFSYSAYLKGARAIKFNFLVIVPSMLFVSLVNPLFNHRGATILGYVRDNPITLESIVYGVITGMMFASILLWFSCYNAVMTSDKFIYLFGRVIPALSLIFSMVLRFVPKFKAQIGAISNAQKCVGRDIGNGKILERAKHGLKILSIMTTWALENAIDTADSMKSRGYGLHGRTAFSIFRFDSRDKVMLAVEVVMITVVLASAFFGQTAVQYFPSIIMKPFTVTSMMLYILYFALCFLPVILDIKEDLKWRHLQSRT